MSMGIQFLFLVEGGCRITFRRVQEYHPVAMIQLERAMYTLLYIQADCNFHQTLQLIARVVTESAHNIEGDPNWVPSAIFLDGCESALFLAYWHCLLENPTRVCARGVGQGFVIFESTHMVPEQRRTICLAMKYKKENWHTKFWTLLTRKPFQGPTPGPTRSFGDAVPTPMQCFLKLWKYKIQQKLVLETYKYA